MAGFGMRGTPVLVSDGTDIDRSQCKRIVPMKVLVLGLCRTGTMCKWPQLPISLAPSRRGGAKMKKKKKKNTFTHAFTCSS